MGCCVATVSSKGVQVKEIPDKLEYPDYISADIVFKDNQCVCVVYLPEFENPCDESTNLKTE